MTWSYYQFLCHLTQSSRLHLKWLYAQHSSNVFPQQYTIEIPLQTRPSCTYYKKREKWHLLPDLFHFFSSTFFLLRRSHPDFTMNHHFPAQRLLLSVVGNFLVIRKRSTVFDFKYKKIWVTLLTQFYLKRQSNLYFPQCTLVSGKGWELIKLFKIRYIIQIS